MCCRPGREDIPKAQSREQNSPRIPAGFPHGRHLSMGRMVALETRRAGRSDSNHRNAAGGAISRGSPRAGLPSSPRGAMLGRRMSKWQMADDQNGRNRGRISLSAICQRGLSSLWPTLGRCLRLACTSLRTKQSRNDAEPTHASAACLGRVLLMALFPGREGGPHL